MSLTYAARDSDSPPMHSPRAAPTHGPAPANKRLQGEHVDALIIGAGAMGAFWAERLSRAGRSVLVLESGPDWSLSDLKSSQIWSRRLKWGGAPVESAGENKFGYNMSTGWGLGGSALHHYAGWPRLHPEDFRTHEMYGRARDWPIAYEDLRPWYDRIQAEVMLSGDALAEIWRPPGAAYPQPPLRTFRQGELIAEGFMRLGLRVAPAPLAILSQPVPGRQACQYDGWCDAGCPIGALANPLVSFIPRARAAGAQFVTGAHVSELLIHRMRCEGVVWHDSLGRSQRQYADMVILAGGTVQNSRLLLSLHKDIVDRMGPVGQDFSCHAVPSIYGIFEEPVQNYLGVSAGQLISQDRYGKQARGPTGAFGSHQWGIAPALKPNDLLGIANTRVDLFGASLAHFVERDGPKIGSMSAICETLPGPQRRIELASIRDPVGVPLARVVNTLDRDALELFAAVNLEGQNIMKAAGAKTVWSGIMATTHATGGTIMGSGLSDSVCDSYGQMHSIPNILVSGASLFPTSGGGSPTFTLYALADRASDHVLKHWSQYVR